MPEIYDKMEEFKASLLSRDRAAALRLIRAYGPIWTRLQRKLTLLTTRIEAAKAAGEPISDAWLFRQSRFRELMEQIALEISKFSEFANREITAEQRAAVRAARKDSERLLLANQGPAVKASFSRLSASAVESIAGFLGNGSPLTALLGELPKEASRAVSTALQEAVALGYNPRKTASQIKSALGGNLTRALRISRTETLRAYREATHQTYKINSDVLEGWYWLATLNSRTCAACIALNGSFHDLDERMASHVQCRCTAIPAIKGDPPPIEQGEKWFEEQPEKTQRAILESDAAFEAYKAGELKLTDLVGRRDSPQWGTSYFHLSLKRALAGQGQFPGYRGSSAPIEAAAFLRPPQLTAADARQKLANIAMLHEGEAIRAKEVLDHAIKAAELAANSSDRTHEGLSYMDWWHKRRELRNTFDATQEVFNQKAREVLYQDSSATFKVTNRKIEPNWQQGIEAFRRLIGSGLIDDFKVTFKKIRGRAKYGLKDDVRVTAEESPSVIVHELGHWLEDKHAGIFEDVSAFLGRRTAGERAVHLGRGYGRGEITKPDKFMNAYVGKIYNNRVTGKRYASEIVSMGLQYFYERPAEFARRDPDFFDFIFNLVRRG